MAILLASGRVAIKPVNSAEEKIGSIVIAKTAKGDHEAGRVRHGVVLDKGCWTKRNGDVDIEHTPEFYEKLRPGMLVSYTSTANIHESESAKIMIGCNDIGEVFETVADWPSFIPKPAATATPAMALVARNSFVQDRERKRTEPKAYLQKA